MKYMLLIMNRDPINPPAKETDYPAIFAQFQKLTADLQAQGKFLHSARLRPEARTVRVGSDGSRTVTDGPFLETKEVVGGYFLIDAPDLDSAVSWAARCPGAKDGAIEVRPIWEM